jgi:hypothetical protein
MIVDDHGKRLMFYASTLQEAICGEPPCSTVVNQPPHLSMFHCPIYIFFAFASEQKTVYGSSSEFELELFVFGKQEASRRVGEELVKACKELEVSEVSCYDRNGFARGEKVMAFEDPIAQHGFLPR